MDRWNALAIEMCDQRGNVAEPNDPTRMPRHGLHVQSIQQPHGSVPAPSHNYTLDSGIGKRPHQVCGALIIGSCQLMRTRLCMLAYHQTQATRRKSSHSSLAVLST